MRQEALFEKLAALTKKVKASARQGPGLAPSDEVRALAGSLLFEVEVFRPQRSKIFPHPGPDHAGLAAQLAEALGVLVAFEARHTGWDARFQEPVWLVDGAVMRVRRLRPRPGSRAAARVEARARAEADARAARLVELRMKLVTRLEQFERRGPQHPS
ncbi:hypothetical protein DMC47_04830 [Nostoc sp. 3335mG]|nr:hypothetical protein DMC47_04830 [Nostoc sp. 3335mG]